MKLLELYQKLHDYNPFGQDVADVANWFYVRKGPNRARMLKAIHKLVLRGDEIGCISYTLPTDFVYLNGVVVTPEELMQTAELIND